ncbi:hypothetical protein PV11_05065 [Exophiala sideris]|uniref:Uncharacterized protein n=1 Tax=Exophiala sideris TaxID=1016849 RepID=A0A0D1YP90_9EURO|nr:hypothetical protein PV11_05065 [Exophiala sideris]
MGINMAIKRTTTTHLKSFERKDPEAVIYDVSRPECVTITIPAASQWTSGAHWHETHTEYLQILQGRALVRLGQAARELGPGDDVIEVPMFTVHEWHRVKDDNGDEDLIVREWTVPEDGQKEVFFRMLNSVLTEERPSSLYTTPRFMPQWVGRWIERWIVMMQLFAIFRAGDNWPVFVGGKTSTNGDSPGLLGWVVTHVILYVGSWVGYVLGLRSQYGEYVTDEMLDKGKTAKKSESRKGK